MAKKLMKAQAGTTVKPTAKPEAKPAAKAPAKSVIPEYEKNKMNTGVKSFDNYINGVRKRMETDTTGLGIFPFKKGGAMKKMAKGGSTKKK